MLSVDCGTDWTADNSATDIFTATITSSTSLVVSAEQNYVEEDRTAILTLYTATRRIKFATINIVQSAYGAPEITVETNEWNAPAAGELSTDIAVEATADWIAEVADAWLTVEKSGDGITLTAEENKDTEERETKVTLACTDGYRTTYEYINVSQAPKAYVTLSVENVLLARAGDSATVIVESNYDWDFSYDSDNGWYTVTRDGNILTVTSSKDNETDDDLEGVIAITAGDGAKNVVEVQISVVEENTANALILVYTITDADTEITLPLVETVNCTVNWGDGSSEAVTSTKPTHTYETAGEYAVVINGTVTGLSHSGIASSSKVNTTLTAIKQWGNTGLTSMDHAFYYCKGLTDIPEDSLGAFVDVTAFSYAFAYCSGITTIPAGLLTYASKSTTFTYLFYYCPSLTSIPEGLLDNAISGTNFNYVFGYCSELTSIPAGLFGKCTAAETFQYAFRSCTGVTTIGDGVFDGCTKATSFYYAFGYLESLKEIPKDIFVNNTEVTSFYGVFRDCTSLTSIPENLFANCSKVTTFGYVFYNCPLLTSVPESTFSGCSSVTTFTYAFWGCTALTSVPEKLFSDCATTTTFTYAFRGSGLTSVPGGLFSNNTAATTFQGVFYACEALKEIGSGLFANNSAATSFSQCFRGCTALTSIPENLFANCKSVTNFGSTFYGCTALTGESAYDVVMVGDENVNVHIYERENYTDETYGYTAPTSYSSCYDSCTGLSDYYTGIPKAWGGGLTIDLSAVLGTYTAKGYAYYSNGVATEQTWELKIYASSKSGYEIFIDGLTPLIAGYYPTYEYYIAQANYTDGQIVIPAQLTGYMNSSGYIGWYPCSQFVEGTGWYRDQTITSLTFTYDSATDTWTSDYGAFLALFSIGSASYSYFSGFMDVANPGITLKRTSTETSTASTQSLKSDDGAVRKIDSDLVVHTEGFLAE